MKTPSRVRMFRPISWRDRVSASSLEYVSHILRELGRLGLEVHDVESRDRPPNTRTVLSDLLDWMSERPGKAFAQLHNWQILDLNHICSRIKKNRLAKPRIEISARITKMNNLSVRWHPGGWRHTDFDWGKCDYDFFNLVTHRTWRNPPDFRWFSGDENPTFDSRPSNELMYIRGVGNLRPEPRESYGPYATHNADVVDSILICAVRAAYESLVSELGHGFEIDVLDAFDFVTRDETGASDPSSCRFPIHRVVAWRLEDAAQLRERRDRAELDNVTANLGLGLDTFVAALLHASSGKPGGPIPSADQTHRKAAKELRNAGFSVNAADVRRIRQLTECYSPEILPETLRSATPTAPK